MFTESIAQRDQSSSPRAPSSSRPGGGAWPRLWPSSTRRSAGGPSLSTARTMQTSAAATRSPTWPRTRSQPALRGHRADPGRSLRSGRRFRHYPLEQLPQLVRHQPLNDCHASRLPDKPNEMTFKLAQPARGPEGIWPGPTHVLRPRDKFHQEGSKCRRNHGI